MGTKNALLVYPQFPPSYWGFRYALELLGKRSAMPPLGLLTVAAMFPQSYNLRLVDLNVTDLCDQDLDWADLVLTSTMVVQRRSLQEVVTRANRAGKPIVVGGPHPTSFSDEIRGADYLLVDEVEETFPRFLADWEAGRAEHLYRPASKPAITSTPVPRFELLDFSAYSSMALQFSRGCPFDCEFCDITKLFGRVPRTKSNAQMIGEFDRLYELGWRGPVFLVDDNFIGNKKEAMRLLPDLGAWQKERDYPFDLFTEASLNLAKLEPLMDAMVEAGFTMAFLGIESPNPEALRRTKKIQNIDREDDHYLLHAVRTIQRKGLEVTGGFIIGLDGDGPEVFDAQVEFIEEAGIPTAMVGLLTAIRGTDLYARMEREGRLVAESTGNNVEVALNFRPLLDRDVLIEGYRRVLSRLYDPALKSYFARCWTLLKNLPPNSYHRGRRIGKTELRALWRSFRRQLGSRQGPAYFGLLARTVLHRPRLFAEAVRLGILGYHLQKFTQQILAAHDFREEALASYDRVERLASAELPAGAESDLRSQVEEALRRLRRLHRRLRSEFRQGLFPDWAWTRDAIRDCHLQGRALRVLDRVRPHLQRLFAGNGWLAALKAGGYVPAEQGQSDLAGVVAVAPLLEHGRMRRSLELYFHELGVKVVTATEQVTRLGHEKLERLTQGGETQGRLLDYLRSLGRGVDTVVVPLSEPAPATSAPAEVLVAEPVHGEPSLPRLICLRVEGSQRRLRDALAELGMRITGDAGRVEAALDRALALI